MGGSEVGRKNYCAVLGIAILKWVSTLYYSVHYTSLVYTTASKDMSTVSSVTSVPDPRHAVMQLQVMQWCNVILYCTVL